MDIKKEESQHIHEQDSMFQTPQRNQHRSEVFYTKLMETENQSEVQNMAQQLIRDEVNSLEYILRRMHTEIQESKSLCYQLKQTLEDKEDIIRRLEQRLQEQNEEELNKKQQARQQKQEQDQIQRDTMKNTIQQLESLIVQQSCHQQADHYKQQLNKVNATLADQQSHTQSLQQQLLALQETDQIQKTKIDSLKQELLIRVNDLESQIRSLDEQKEILVKEKEKRLVYQNAEEQEAGRLAEVLVERLNQIEDKTIREKYEECLEVEGVKSIEVVVKRQYQDPLTNWTNKSLAMLVDLMKDASLMKYQLFDVLLRVTGRLVKRVLALKYQGVEEEEEEKQLEEREQKLGDMLTRMGDQVADMVQRDKQEYMGANSIGVLEDSQAIQKGLLQFISKQTKGFSSSMGKLVVLAKESHDQVEQHLGQE